MIFRNYNDEGLSISYLIFIYNFLDRKPLVYENIHKIEHSHKNLTLTGKFILKKLKMMIEEREKKEIMMEKTDRQVVADQDFLAKKSTSSTSLITTTKVYIPKALKLKLAHQMNKHMKRATTNLIYQWKMVNDGNPTLQKMNRGVKESHKAVENCLDFYEKNLLYFNSVPSIQELYGRFLLDVLDKRKEGMSIVKDAVESLRKIARKKMVIKNMNFLTKIADFSQPCLILKKLAVVSK